MKSKNELSYKDLKITCNPKIFQFKTTEELEPINTGIGNKAVRYFLREGRHNFTSENWDDLLEFAKKHFL
jgi:hypothetical protein